MCKVCNVRPRAIAYHKYDRVYYHSRCTACLRKNKKLKPPVPRWQSSGYKKKPTCDRCGFRARLTSQLLVYHVDGDLDNAALKNLRTVCRNCVEEISRTEVIWRPGDLEPDA